MNKNPQLSYREVKITDKEVDLVEFHVRRFNPIGQAELKMVELADFCKKSILYP